MDDTRYCALDFAPTRVGPEGMTLRSRSTGEQHDLSGLRAHLYSMCGQRRSLRGHAERFVAALPAEELRALSDPDGGSPAVADPVSVVTGWLQEFRAAGLLSADDEIERRILAAAGGEDTPPITTVGVPTRSNAAGVLRALASVWDALPREHAEMEYVVADDVGDPGASEDVRRELAAAAATHGKEVRFCSWDDRARYAARLARAGAGPEELVAFALGHPATSLGRYGASRNVLILDSVGELSLCTDDDTICDLRAWPQGAEGLSITTAQDAGVYRFTESYAEALSLTRPVATDIVSAHEKLLGRVAADCVRAALERGEPVHLPEHAAGVPGLFDSRARVLVSMTGSVGDCGGPDPRGTRAILTGPLYDWLVADEDKFVARLLGRQLAKCAPGYTLATTPYFAAITYALDNRALIPPFPPVMAAEDTLFGYVLHGMSPTALRGFVPCAALHDPDSRRPNLVQPAPFVHFANVVLGDIMGASDVARAEEPAKYLVELGTFLDELSTSAPAAFRDFVSPLARKRIEAELRHWEKLLAWRADAPDFWRRHMARMIDDRRAFLRDADPAAADDFAGGPAERQAAFQDYVGTYGRLLAAWPTIVEAARHLRARGDRLSTPVA